jgi:hypothetical protein
VVLDALKGLTALHERGIVHGGITSAEVVIEAGTAGGFRTRLLADGLVGTLLRGIARRAGKRGKLYGSAHHMAPEQCRGEALLLETDVWAMGVVLHEALVASLPFDGGSPLEVIASVLGEDPAPLDARVPAPIAEVVRQCLAKRAGDRLPDAEAVALALTAALETLRASQVPRVSVKPTPAKLQLPEGLHRGQAIEVDDDGLDALIATVKSEQTPATDFDAAFDTAPPLDAAPPTEAIPDLDFHTVVGPAQRTAASTQAPASIPGPMLPPPPTGSVPAPSLPDPTAALAHLDALTVSSASSTAATSPSIPVRASQVHTALTADTIDRTKVPIHRRPKAINPYVAFMGVALVTGGLVWGGWTLSGAGDPPRPVAREAGVHRPIRARAPRSDGSMAPDPVDPEEDPERPADPNAPRPEAQVAAEFGVQLTIPLPEGLASDAALQFVRHVVAAAPPDRASVKGFASCTSTAVYLHAGGLDPRGLRSAPVATRCDAADLALVADVDGDTQPDVVAVDARGDGLVVLGSRNLRVGRRITVQGALAVVGGLSRQDRRRSEPVVVTYTQGPGEDSALVAVGLRSGRVLWRTLSGFTPASPKDYGLTVGPDVDRDGTPDVAVGILREGHRCVTVLSGATGVLQWPAPRCFEGASPQVLTLGPDLNSDGRAELSVANTTEGKVRILSGEDGRELRVVTATQPGEGMIFGLSAALLPDLARDGFPDVALGRTQNDAAMVEVYSANDGHRVASWRVTSREPSGVAAIRVDYLENFAFPGSRSLLVATTTGVQVLAAAARPEVHDPTVGL